MSKINYLINKLCPNGVEYEELGNICISLKKGTLKTIELLEAGYPVINSGRNLYGYYNQYNNDGNAFTIAARGEYAGYINYFDEKFWAGGLCYPYKSKNENLVITKYIYYFLKNKEKKIRCEIVSDGSIPALNKSDLEKIKIPILPLEIQEEIIKISEKFEQLESKLELELETELKVRKKQYEFWYEKVFLFDNVEVKTIKEICTDVIVPMRDKPKCFDGTIPWCRIDDIEGNYFNTSKSGQFVSEETINKMNLKIFPKGTVICSCSASIGTYAINTQPLITNQTFIGLVCSEKILNKYLFYFMKTQTKRLLELSNAGTIPYISRKKFENLEVPIPSLEEQSRIVNILDRFDRMFNNLSNGFLAEIELRRKQYEYYRNKLLSFEELSVSE